MTKQISIRDEDYELARDLAERLGTPIDEVVSSALRGMPRPLDMKRPLDASEQGELAELRALVEEARRHIVPGATSDHAYLYDDDGLPV